MASTLTTAFKSAILASALLCLGVAAISNEIDFFIIPIGFISTVVTFIISFFMIIITISPFVDFPDNLSPQQKFNRYFPYYAITYFVGCFFIMFASNFELYTSLIFGITYLTAMQAWVWYFKQNNKAL